MTPITWASPRYVQELATILGPQNRTQERCDTFNKYIILILMIRYSPRVLHDPSLTWWQ